MKIVQTVSVIACGKIAQSPAWADARAGIHDAVRAVDWPPGTGKFIIHPEKDGNGVKPIKTGMMADLARQGWMIEGRAKNAAGRALGNFDAVRMTPEGPFVVEWETGNISSSHRSMNKLAMLLSQGILAAGSLVVPSRELYRYLTDRIGNISELEPYLELWRSIPCKNGVLEMIVIEHDATSTGVPRIPKGTDGRARG
jgi:Restriction endonuclease BamHI